MNRFPRYDFSNQTVVVTGAARGIGQAVTTAFLRAGARVAAIDREAGPLGSLVDEFSREGLMPRPYALDVTDSAAAERTFFAITDALGPIDICINNAGIAIRGPAIEMSADDWRRVVDVNVTGAFLTARLAARSMMGRGGSIVNLASVMGFSGGIFPNAAYQSSKGAVVNMTRALALEWAPEGIRVNAVAPTYVDTPLTHALLSNPDNLAKVMVHTPLGRLPTPEDVAQAALFLASDASACVTGHILAVDSGYLAR